MTLDKLNIHGTLNDNPQDDKMLLLVRDSTDVTVSNSEFQQGWNALSHIDTDGLKVLNNSFHDLRCDGVRGGGSSNLTISGNYFTDFYPVDGDHADAIQLWTTNTTEPATDITISNNVVNRGDGSPTQGIFIRDTFMNLPYERVSITGNTVVGAMYNGISVINANGLEIKNNVVAGTDQKSWIRVIQVSDAKIANNQATDFAVIDSPSAVRSGNVQLGYLGSEMVGKISTWLDTTNTKLSSLGDALGKTFDKQFAAYGVVDGTASERAATASQYEFEERFVAGTNGNDRLSVGSIGDYRIEAGNGDDVLTGGGSGYAYLVGGKGDDNYIVKSIDDYVVEAKNEGNDTVSTYVDFHLGANVETLRLMTDGLTGWGNELDNRIVGSTGDDTIYAGDGKDVVQGAAGHDKIWGGLGNDDLRGDDGDDYLYGEAGDDTLTGGNGNDWIEGGDGKDSLQGGAGADRLIGGAGADTFMYRPGDFDGGVKVMDVIADFSSAQKDKINLSPIDANSKTVADDKFAFIGTNAFHKIAGELRYEKVGGDSIVTGDINGDGVADFSIKLLGVSSLSAADFVL